MYKVLLVDDERIIREGISKIIDWEGHGFCFIGAAENAIEAYDMIQKQRPHIVITDIKMPVMSGLELIRKTKEIYEDIVFIVLSGYGEFELASQAMRYGVKYYLLKPCNENTIIEALNNARAEIVQREKRQQFIKKNVKTMQKILPLVKEQFIRDYVMGKGYTVKELDYYCNLLNIKQQELLRMVIFQVSEEYNFESVHALGNVIEEVCDGDEIYYKTIIKNQIMLLVRPMEDESLLRIIDKVKSTFFEYSNIETTVSYGDKACFKDMPAVFRQLQECFKYSMYFEEGSIITPKDIEFLVGEDKNEVLALGDERITLAIKSGNIQEVESLVNQFFSELKKSGCVISLAKLHCIELYMKIIRGCPYEKVAGYIEKTVDLQNMDSINEIQQFILNAAKELANENHMRLIKRRSAIVDKLMKYVEANISNEDLSLKWIAKNVLYMNEVYLSKLFSKETGEKFSHYLTKVRIEKALELMKNSNCDKVYEIAQQVGLGKNPQYFSQVFKKYTGYTPTEYMEKLLSQ